MEEPRRRLPLVVPGLAVGSEHAFVRNDGAGGDTGSDAAAGMRCWRCVISRSACGALSVARGAAAEIAAVEQRADAYLVAEPGPEGDR